MFTEHLSVSASVSNLMKKKSDLRQNFTKDVSLDNEDTFKFFEVAGL